MGLWYLKLYGVLVNMCVEDEDMVCMVYSVVLKVVLDIIIMIIVVIV